MLAQCRVSDLAIFLEAYGVSVHRPRILSSLPGPRGIGAATPLAQCDGASIYLVRGPRSESTWAVAHMFAHILQWHVEQPKAIHPAFSVRRSEARRLSARPLHLLRGRAFERAVTQEVEAHLLTAATLGECFHLDPITLKKAAMEKLSREMRLLASVHGGDDVKVRTIARIVSRRKRGALPVLPTPDQVKVRHLFERFQPYLWFKI